MPHFTGLLFFPPYSLHGVIRNVPRWFRQRNCREAFLQRRRENATCNQAPLLFRTVVYMAVDDSRHRLVALANQHFVTALHQWM